MANDPDTGEQLIDFFKAANINAVHRVLERAQRDADKGAKRQAASARSLGRSSLLASAMNKAMASYGRAAKGRASIRRTAPDTGGRPYHFGYTTVTKGESARGRAGRTGSEPAPHKTAKSKAGRPTAKTRESAHQVYTERDSAVERNGAPLETGRDLDHPIDGEPGRQNEASREREPETAGSEALQGTERPAPDPRSREAEPNGAERTDSAGHEADSRSIHTRNGPADRTRSYVEDQVVEAKARGAGGPLRPEALIAPEADPVPGAPGSWAAFA